MLKSYSKKAPPSAYKVKIKEVLFQIILLIIKYWEYSLASFEILGWEFLKKPFLFGRIVALQRAIFCAST